MENQTFLKGDEAYQKWLGLCASIKKPGEFYSARRRVGLPADVPESMIRVEWHMVCRAFGAHMLTGYETGEVIVNPSNCLSYHALIGSTPNKVKEYALDLDGKFSMAGWLMDVERDPKHFMPSNALNMYNVEDALRAEEERRKVEKLAIQMRAAHKAKAAAEEVLLPNSPQDVWIVTVSTSDDDGILDIRELSKPKKSLSGKLGSWFRQLVGKQRYG